MKTNVLLIIFIISCFLSPVVLFLLTGKKENVEKREEIKIEVQKEPEKGRVKVWPFVDIEYNKD